MFCKKCHKRMIKIFKSNHDYMNVCMCIDKITSKTIIDGTEMNGLINSSTKKRKNKKERRREEKIFKKIEKLKK